MEENLLNKIKQGKVPYHIAIIMDGNRRWAHCQGLSLLEGHKRGANVLKEICKGAVEAAVKILTVYAFSLENWRRSIQEIRYLLYMFRHFAIKEREELLQAGIRIKVIGKLEKIPLVVRKALEDTETITSKNSKLLLNLAINYGSRVEILDATRKIAEEVKRGSLMLEQINEHLFSSYLYTASLPDPDLLIRTSGEMRLSNFLLWQCAYTEFWFTPKYWPEFSREDFYKAILDFQRRERRFGGGRVT